MVAPHAIEARHNQLIQFCAVPGLPKSIHRKLFNAITKKVHLTATKPMADNLELAQEVTAKEAAFANVAVIFDGTWEK